MNKSYIDLERDKEQRYVNKVKQLRLHQEIYPLGKIAMAHPLPQAFDDGDRESFNAIWQVKGLFSASEQHSSKAYVLEGGRKLEFYLQIYFTTYPLSPLRTSNSRILQHEMSLFKHYIETTGSQDPVLSQTSEFVTYYALPYVPNPFEHKSFKHLFTREFV